MKILRTGLITETGVIPITLFEDEFSSLPPLPEIDDDETYGPYFPEDWTGASSN